MNTTKALLHLRLVFLFLTLVQTQPFVHAFGPPAICYNGELYVYSYTANDPATPGSPYYDNYLTPGGLSITVREDYSVNDSSNLYDPNTQTFGGGGYLAVDSDLLTLLGVSSSSGLIIRSTSSFSGIYNGSTWITPDNSFTNPSGVTVAYYQNLPDGTLFSTGSSPVYVYYAWGSPRIIDNLGGNWPPSDIFSTPPQTVYVNDGVFVLNSIVGGIASNTYFVETLTYLDPNLPGSNVTIDRYYNQGTTWGDLFVSGFVTDNCTFDPGSWQISNFGDSSVAISFSPPPQVPSVGPFYISWNNRLLHVAYTSPDDTDHYESANRQLRVTISMIFQVAATDQNNNTAFGSYDPSSGAFTITGSADTGNFVGLGSGGDPLGLPDGLLLTFGSDGFGNSIGYSVDSYLQPTYHFVRPDGRWSVKYIGLPIGQYIVIADNHGNYNSQLYYYGSAEMDIDATNGWPLSNAFPAGLYVNGVVCPLRWETNFIANPGQDVTGGASYISSDGVTAVTLSWAWNGGTGVTWTWSFDGQSGDWNGSNVVLSNGAVISLSAPPTGPSTGPASLIWNGLPLTYNSLASQLAGGDAYEGGGIRVVISANGSATVIDTNSGSVLYSGTYDPSTHQFNFGSANFGSVSAVNGSGQILATTTSGSNGGSGNLDVLGNMFSLGSWQNGTNTFPGFILTFTPPSAADLPASLQFSGTVALTDWIWNHANANGTSGYTTAMKLDSGHRLSLFDPGTPGSATVVLDPGQGSSFHGPLRVQPQGDISMGSYQSSPVIP